MARGWESKAVEAQQADVERPHRAPPPATAAERAWEQRRRSLELARARAAADLTSATAPAHRRMLEQTIAAIETRLQSLPRGT